MEYRVGDTDKKINKLIKNQRLECTYPKFSRTEHKYCGGIGEVIDIVGKNTKYIVKFSNDEGNSFLLEWISQKVEFINIDLRRMRNEI